MLEWEHKTFSAQFAIKCSCVKTSEFRRGGVEHPKPPSLGTPLVNTLMGSLCNFKEKVNWSSKGLHHIKNKFCGRTQFWRKRSCNFQVWGKVTGKGARVDAVKACRGSRSTVPLILNLGTGWGWFAANCERSTDMLGLTMGILSEQGVVTWSSLCERHRGYLTQI